MAGDPQTGTRGVRSRASADVSDFTDGIRRASSIGVVAYAAFSVFDLVLYLIVYERASLALVLSYRACGIAVLSGWYFYARSQHGGLRPMIATTSALLGASALVMALIANQLGGLHSPYVNGPAFYFVALAVLAPSPWRRMLVVLAPVYVLFFAGLAITVAVDHPASFRDAQALTHVLIGAFIQASLLGFATVASHMLWASRAQLYRARRLGRYRLQAPLGAGGMNEVWLARDENLRRDVAIKVLRGASSTEDDRWMRFEREAQVASSLTSPHTVKIYDYGASDDGIAYIAMEFLRGLDLADVVLGYGPMDVRRAVHCIRQATSSLAEAHQRGLVHRDVKPANLFVLSSGDAPDFVKVLDFGLVRELTRAPGEDTREGVTLGTPAFMAPEQFLGADVTAASDVYGLGATLYFLLTGVAPFEDRGGGDAALWRAHSAQPLVPASQRRGAELPRQLESVIACCMAKHPSDRYRDATALAKALDDLPEVGAWTPGEAQAWWNAARLTPISSRKRASTSSKVVTVATKNQGVRTPTPSAARRDE